MSQDIPSCEFSSATQAIFTVSRVGFDGMYFLDNNEVHAFHWEWDIFQYF